MAIHIDTTGLTQHQIGFYMGNVLNEIIRRDGGYVEYRQDGKLHRANGPACLNVNRLNHGAWYLFGNRHRYYSTHNYMPSNGLEMVEEWIIHGKKIT